MSGTWFGHSHVTVKQQTVSMQEIQLCQSDPTWGFQVEEMEFETITGNHWYKKIKKWTDKWCNLFMQLERNLLTQKS